MPAIPEGSLVVVTGITGFIGSHIALAALKAGLRVRGTARDPEKAKDIPSAFEKQGADVTKLEIVPLDDLTSEEQYTRVLNGADGVIHVAIPGGVIGVSVPTTVEANLALLRVAKNQRSVKRVVLCSSSTAVETLNQDLSRTLTENDWNDAVVEKYNAIPEEERDQPQNFSVRYSAAKTLAEKAAWKFMEDTKPEFDLVAVLPNVNLGPVLSGPPTSSAARIWDLLQGNSAFIAYFPPHQWFVDVRDDARLHVLSLTTPSLGGKRLWAVAEPFGWNRILAYLRKHFPDAPIPADVSGPVGDAEVLKIDNSAATSLLGKWIPLEQTVVDTAKAYGF